MKEYSVTENVYLDSFLMEMGILPKQEFEELEEIIDPRKECMAKGYYRNPHDENTGELLF